MVMTITHIADLRHAQHRINEQQALPLEVGAGSVDPDLIQPFGLDEIPTEELVAFARAFAAV